MAFLRAIRTKAVVAAAAIGALVIIADAARAQPSALETAIKANYLYKFAPFVDWPPVAFAGPAAPLTICVAGQDPFGTTLDASVRSQQVGTHPIAVRRLHAGQPVSGCHILYFGRLSAQHAAEMLHAAAGQPVLTVTDEDAGGAGGMIRFVLRDGRVRFDIDADAAKASGVQISSKLLGLAVSVRKGASR